MSVLYYDIPIEERLDDESGNLIDYYKKELPHHKQIKDEFPSLVESARLINGFEKNVQSFYQIFMELYGGHRNEKPLPVFIFDFIRIYDLPVVFGILYSKPWMHKWRMVLGKC